MKYYSKNQARKYLIRLGLHFNLNRKLWKEVLDSGRLFPEKRGKYSQAQLYQYYLDNENYGMPLQPTNGVTLDDL